jgi:AbrB family looped-hinge helix DNA binding protein
MPILAGNANQTEWVKVLTKGLITIPKRFRDQLGLNEGEVAQVRKWGRRLIIQPREVVDYEVYTNQELDQMMVEDKLPEDLAAKASEFWPDLK